MTSKSHTIVSLVNSLGLFASVAPIPWLFRKPIGTQALNIIRGFAFQERFDEQLADARRTGNAVRVATASHNKALYSPTFSNDESAIRRKRRPTFCDRLNLSR